MKRILLLLSIAFALGACSTTPNNKINYTAPSTAPLRQSIETVRDHSNDISKAHTAAIAKATTVKDKLKVLQKAVENSPPILQLAVDIEGKVDELTNLLLTAEASNTALRQVVDVSLSQVATLQAKVQAQTDLLNTANDNLNKAITQGALDKKHAHEYKWTLIALAVGATGLLVFSIFGAVSFVPPLLYVLLGAPGVVGTFLYFWLGSG